MSVDRKFEILRPSLDRLSRLPLEVANLGLINPQSTSPLALVDGELVQIDIAGKWARATDATKPSHVAIDDRGDYGIQASRKLTAVVGGGHFIANTVLFNSGLTTIGTPVKYGSVTVESLARAGLVDQAGSGIILGYVMKVSAANGGKLQVLWTFN
jgi:hypothetical protein